MVARGWGGGWGGSEYWWVWVSSFWGDENVWNFMVVMVVQHCECVKCHRTAHLKVVTAVNVMFCVLYNKKETQWGDGGRQDATLSSPRGPSALLTAQDGESTCDGDTLPSPLGGQGRPAAAQTGRVMALFPGARLLVTWGFQPYKWAGGWLPC